MSSAPFSDQNTLSPVQVHVIGIGEPLILLGSGFGYSIVNILERARGRCTLSGFHILEDGGHSFFLRKSCGPSDEAMK